MKHEFHCSVCDQDKVHISDFSTGYGTDPQTDAKVCFDCCGVQDKAALFSLEPKEKMVLYWSGGMVTNWPNTLTIKPYYTRKSKTNWNLERTDFWFKFHGNKYHGYHIGHNNQIAHVYKIKS